MYDKNRNKINDVASYQRWANELNFDGIDFPVKLNQIEKFMKQNDHLAINVYHYVLFFFLNEWVAKTVRSESK